MATPNIPTYEKWKSDTSLGITKPRSSLMVALDKAIEQYNKSKNTDNLWAIKHAFEAWKASKGTAWAQSDRNRTGAVKRLSAYSTSSTTGPTRLRICQWLSCRPWNLCIESARRPSKNSFWTRMERKPRGV